MRSDGGDGLEIGLESESSAYIAVDSSSYVEINGRVLGDGDRVAMSH